MDHKYFKEGAYIQRVMKSAVNSTAPQEPPLQKLSDYKYVPDQYHQLKTNIGTGDNPVVIQAMFAAILDSDNPTLIAEIKKLYMIAKLAVEADNPGLEDAHEHVYAIDKFNRTATESNERSLKEYKEKFDAHLARIAQSETETFEWFDKFIDNMTAEFAGKTKEQILSKVWNRCIVEAFKLVYTSYGESMRANWFYKKNADFSVFKTSALLVMNNRVAVRKIINDVQDAIEKQHRAFINGAFYEVLTELRASKEYRNQVKDINARYKYTSAIYKGGDVVYYDDYNNPFGSYRKESYSTYNNWREMQDKAEYSLRMAQKRLEDKIEQSGAEIIYERYRAGVDGYDEIYDFMPPPPSLRSNERLDYDEIIEEEYDPWAEGGIRRYHLDQYGNRYETYESMKAAAKNRW